MTRKFLTPIVLPADPAAAMEAATKQYVDGVVVVNPADPIGTTPQTELWFDSDAPGPVTAGVGLPSAGTTGQVLVKKSNTDYDTQWVGAVDYTTLPRGIVGSYSSNVSVACPASVVTYLTTGFSVTFLTGRKYRLAFHFRAVGRTDNTDTSSRANISLYDGTTNLAWLDTWHDFRAQWSSVSAYTIAVGGGATMTALRLGVNSPNTALTIYPSSFVVEDVGV